MDYQIMGKRRPWCGLFASSSLPNLADFLSSVFLCSYLSFSSFAGEDVLCVVTSSHSFMLHSLSFSASCSCLFSIL